MKIRTLLLVSLISFLLACGNAEQKQRLTTSQTLAPSDTNIAKKSVKEMSQEDERRFFTNAAIGGMMEIEASSMILANTKNNPAVSAHAKMIKIDHIKANAELKMIAKKQNFALPTVLPPEKLKALSQMESLNEEAQIEFYINLMATEHNEAINLFDMGSRMPIESISSFANKTLPILKHHYEMTVIIRDAISKAKANQGDDPLKLSDKMKNNPAKNQ